MFRCAVGGPVGPGPPRSGNAAFDNPPVSWKDIMSISACPGHELKPIRRVLIGGR